MSSLFKPLALVLSVSAGTFLVVSGYVHSLGDTVQIDVCATPAAGCEPASAPAAESFPGEAPCGGGILRGSPCPRDLSWGGSGMPHPERRGT